jgi:GTPase SAR1 family protein
MAIDNLKFRIFDLGGQKTFRDEIINLLPFADMIVFVIDSADRKRLDIVAKEFEKILKNTDKKLTPICVLRHKSDLKNAIKVPDLIEKLGLKGVLDRNWNVLSTSAVTLDGLKDLFSWIYKQTTGEVPEFLLDFKRDAEYTFHYPCPMRKELDTGSNYCLNQDGFEETELTCFGFQDEVNKMVLKVIPDLRKESLKTSGKDICPDFCILKNGEKILRCPVTMKQICTRGIRVSLKRYKDALVLSKIYGSKFGEDICRDCMYKIILSPDTILSEQDLKDLKKSTKLLG